MKIKYIILICSILTVSSNLTKGQSLCEPNGITTNPDAPNNPLNQSMENTFFDWRVDDFLPYFDPNYFSAGKRLQVHFGRQSLMLVI